jgi:hypothetical protein
MGKNLDPAINVDTASTGENRGYTQIPPAEA